MAISLHKATFHKIIRPKFHYEALISYVSCILKALGPRKVQPYSTIWMGQGIRCHRWRHGKGSRWVVNGGCFDPHVHQKFESLRTECKYYTTSTTKTPSGLGDEKLTVIHLNIRSILNNEKFDALVTFLYLACVHWDIICISETWLNNDIDKLRNLKGYTAFFENRTDRPGGGVARPARTFFKRNQKIRAGRTERCRHWTTHVSRQETRREKHPIRKLNPARPGRLLFPSHFPICQPDRPSVGSHLTPTGNYKHLDTISSAAATPDTRPRDHVCPREEEPATRYAGVQSPWKGSRRRCGYTFESRRKTREGCEMPAEADVAEMGVAPGAAAAQFTERRTQTGHRCDPLETWSPWQPAEVGGADSGEENSREGPF